MTLFERSCIHCGLGEFSHALDGAPLNPQSKCPGFALKPTRLPQPTLFDPEQLELPEA